MKEAKKGRGGIITPSNIFHSNNDGMKRKESFVIKKKKKKGGETKGERDEKMNL